MVLSDNINRLMESQNVSNGDLARYIGDVSNETVRRWRNGTNIPPIDKALKIAEYFHISVDTLLGSPLNTEQNIRLPLVGAVSAGPFDILNEDEWDDTRSVSARLLAGRPRKECVTVEVTGDSMQPFLFQGDILVVHRQNYAVNGNIIVAYDPVQNGYTVKRFDQVGDSITLTPYNGSYEPIRYTNPDDQQLGIYGVCVGLERKLV